MPATATDTIPALTICQPYASLIMLPDSDPEKKRVENRCWRLAYRGPLAIHAGRSRKWLGSYYDGPMPKDMPFGVIVGIVNVVECIGAHWTESQFPKEFEWVKEHIHAEGPWCIVLANPRRLREPIPYRGAQKLWRVPRELVADVL